MKTPRHTPKIPPPIIALLAALVMWIVNYGSAKLEADLFLDIPGRAILAAFFAVTGLAIAFVSMGLFKTAKTTVHPLHPEKASTLVTHGLYQVSRNPMYLGLLLVLIAWGVWLANPVNLIILALFILVMNWQQIIPEEIVLEEKFGQAYRDYKTRVRRWV